jgi:XTP/dITP diphosphohydrolase
MKTKIVLASHNKNKAHEYNELLLPLGYEMITMDALGINEEPVEDGKTYQENAYIKAKALRALVDYPVIADDSGIEIAALGEHFPGIYSARYAASLGGDYAIVDRKIVQMMEGKTNRYAAYHCWICLLEEKTSKPRYFEAICEGTILHEIKGTHGFGYDPIFHYDKGNIDFGTASEQEKNAVSHRGMALRKLVDYLAKQEPSKPSRSE